jgi:hypothetical protein
LQDLKFPSYQFNIKREADQVFIFDEVRKKWLVLTPEEWVRQHVVFYLVGEKGYMPGLIGVEKSIKVNQRIKRFDLVCFDQEAKPLLIVECKAPEVPITQHTLEQAMRYNSEVQAKYLMLTNGLEIVVGRINYESKQLEYLQEIPSFEEC